MDPSRRPKAVVLFPDTLDGPHRLEPALRRAGFEVVLRPGAPRPEDADADALVVMGKDRAGLPEAPELVGARLRANRPVLGIGVGALLLAEASGARSAPGASGPLIGVSPVTLTGEGLEDPLFAGFEERFDVVQWQDETFEPLAHATVLASTSRHPQQAFRVGRSIGVLFHPELDVDSYARWLRASPEELARTGREVEEALERDLPRLEQALHPMTLLVERLAQELASDLGPLSGERYLFTVEQANRLAGSAMVLLPGIPRKTPIVRVGDAVILQRPDGARIEGKVRGMASFGDTGAAIPLLVQLQESDVEISAGTEVLTTARPSV